MKFFKPFPTEQVGDPNEKGSTDNWFAVHVRQRKKENKSRPFILLAFMTLSLKKEKKKNNTKKPQ